jgi:uncharacterized protein (DUF1778 family)
MTKKLSINQLIALKGQPNAPAEPEVLQPMMRTAVSTEQRTRLQIDLSPAVAQMLEHASNVLGASKSQLVVQALLQALPGMVDQAEFVIRRSRELTASVKAS